MLSTTVTKTGDTTGAHDNQSHSTQAMNNTFSVDGAIVILPISKEIMKDM